MLDRPQVGPQMDGLLDVVWQAGGTDLLLTAGAPPQMRVHGELRSVMMQTGAPSLKDLTPALVRRA